jgi:hypothetical protein
MRVLKFIIFLSIGLLSCQENKGSADVLSSGNIGVYNQDKEVNIDIQTNGKLTLIDSSWTSSHVDNEGINGLYYPIYYVGKPNDTIRLNIKPIEKFGFFDKDRENEKLAALPDSNNFAIFVDTSYDLIFNSTYYGFIRKYDSKIDTVEYKAYPDSIGEYRAYPILMSNLSDSLLNIYISWDFRNIIRQVKNSRGRWIDYEIPELLFCGVGSRPIIIEPRQMLVAKLLRFKGEIRSECRLKFIGLRQIIYSNSFVDYLDKKQLIKPM